MFEVHVWDDRGNVLHRMRMIDYTTQEVVDDMVAHAKELQADTAEVTWYGGNRAPYYMYKSSTDVARWDAEDGLRWLVDRDEWCRHACDGCGDVFDDAELADGLCFDCYEG